MYPMHTWGHEKTVRRLHGLVYLELDFEALLAATQCIEQGLKRLVRQRMALTKKRVHKPNSPKKARLVPATSAADLDRGLRDLGGLGGISSVWPWLMTESQHLPVAELFDVTVGNGAWDAIQGDGACTATVGEMGQLQFKQSVREFRNTLVHGTTAPKADTTRLYTEAAVAMFAALFDPRSGVAAHGHWDPYNRVPSIRLKSP